MKGVDLDRRGVVKKLGREEWRQNVIRIYYVKEKNTFSIKRKNKVGMLLERIYCKGMLCATLLNFHTEK